MTKESQWGRTRVRVAMGDITLYDGDAVVNAANNAFWMGAGVAGAIKRKGGQAIEAEAMAGGPAAPGEVRVTGAGRLGVRFVLHAAVMAQDLVTSEPFIRLATRNALARADEIGAGRIAFPALGTGVGGFPASDCARAMLHEVHDYLSAHPGTSLEEIAFFLFGEETFAAFTEVLEEFPGGGDRKV
jgi:O-acetyl-ADP-ribose deacetylase (regulator of RNase III)